MKILLRIFLIIFSLSHFACKQDTATQKQTKLTPQLPDSLLLHQADSLYDLAEKITDLKKSDSTLSFHLKALAIREKLLKNDIRLADSYFKIGRIYHVNNKYDVANNFLEKARRNAEASNAPFSLIFEIYSNLVACKTEVKDFATATSMIQRLLHLIQQNDPTNKTMVLETEERLATVYHYSNQEGKALESWLYVIQLSPPNNHELLGRLYYDVSYAYRRLSKFELSLAYVNKSIQEELIWSGTESKTIADRYLRKAFALLDLHKLDSVTYFLHRTLQIRKKIFEEKDSYIYGVKRGLGDFYYRTGRYDSALFYHHQSLNSLVMSFNSSDLFANPKPGQDELNSDLIQGLVKKASSVVRLFKEDSSKTELLNLALNTYLLADSVFTVYRKNILHDDPIMQQLEGKEIPYPEIVGIASKLFQQKKSIEYFEKAFHVMENSRATVLQDALNRVLAFSSAGISKPLLKKENVFIRLRAELIQKLNARDVLQSTRDSLNEKLLLINNLKVDLLEELRKANPNYFLVRYENLPTVDDIQKYLERQQSVYIEYMWSDSAIYELMISPGAARINSIPISAKFMESFSGFISGFRADSEGAIRQDLFKDFCINSSSLYNYLLKDFLTDIKPDAHIIISADGPLATIPFEALITRTPETQEVNYHLPYLVLEHPISYAYSAGVLLKESSRAREGTKLLAFGYAGSSPSKESRGNGFSNLPGTEKEIHAIKEVMKNHVNEYRLKAEASESFFKQQVSDFDIVHLAIHGEGDTLNALNSRLIFRSEKDTREDGSLYAHELYDLDLSKLDLAVLSACESGVGKQQTGEGVMSIARGFAYAGCPSLVISLWKINDRTSAQVMKDFYRYLSDGQLLDVALAKAKADYIHEAGEFNSHPFYWAAFLQVGDVRALDLKKPNWWGWVVVGLGLAFVGYLFNIFFRKG